MVTNIICVLIKETLYFILKLNQIIYVLYFVRCTWNDNCWIL